MFRTKFVDKIKTHTLCPVTFFPPENLGVYEKTREKYCRAGQATDSNMAHAHCMLDTKGYKRTRSVCVIFTACPLQQRLLHECASILRFKYIACLV
jgi:hypothetical protein